jgi:excinuclease UvrABC ATPase subunit
VTDRFTTSELCPECRGARLNATARNVLVAGRTIAEYTAMEVEELVALIREVDHPASAPIVRSLVERLQSLVGIGLGYLTLDRATTTLSGGESQRIKMVRARHDGERSTGLISGT